MVGVGRQRCVDAYEVALCQHLVERRILNAHALFEVFAPHDVVIEHMHIEAARAARHLGADAPQADEAERGVVDVCAHQQEGSPGLPMAGAYVVYPLHDAARGRHE